MNSSDQDVQYHTLFAGIAKNVTRSAQMLTRWYTDRIQTSGTGLENKVTHYIDAVVLPVPRDRSQTYRAVSVMIAAIWREYGARLFGARE